MSDTKPETATVEILGKIMDQLARQIGGMNPDGPKRKLLIDEISDLSQIRAWLRTERSKEILEKADELACELARLKIGDRGRMQIMKDFWIMPSVKALGYCRQTDLRFLSC